MADRGPASRHATLRLVLVPAVVTLAVTILRLTGELLRWNPKYFDRSVGGGGALVGIVWLAFVFGGYFAFRLAWETGGPASLTRAFFHSVLGVAFAIAGVFFPSRMGLQFSFEHRLLYGWSLFVVAALLTLPGWPALFRAMLAYAYLARVPVAVVMFFAFRGNWGTHYDAPQFFAFRGNWGTHYDAPPPDFPSHYGLVAKYLWLGFVPQLAFWVAFTILAGMLTGSVTAAVVRLIRRAPQPA